MKMTPEEKAAFDRGVIVGMGLACSEALSYGADDTAVAAVLNAAGLTTVKAMKTAGLEDFDLDKLRPVLKEMREREQRQAATRKRIARAAEKAEGELA